MQNLDRSQMPRRAVVNGGVVAAAVGLAASMRPGEAAAAVVVGGSGVLDATAAPYNCDPSGRTDSSQGRDQLLADAKASGKTIYWPTGLYKMSAFPAIDFNLRMVGDGVQTPPTNRPTWGADTGGLSYGERSFGSRLWIVRAHDSAPDRLVGIPVVDDTSGPVPGGFDGPQLANLGIFGPVVPGATDWGSAEGWVGVALGSVTSKTSAGYPVRARLDGITIAQFGIGLAGSASVSTFLSLHLVACCTGLQGTYAFNGNTFVAINIETCRDYAIKLIHCHNNTFYGGVTQNNVDMTRTVQESQFGGTPAAARTAGAVIVLDDSCVGNVFSGLYMEDGYDNQDGVTQLKQVVLGPSVGVYGNHFEECRFGSYKVKNPVVLVMRGGNNVFAAYQGTFDTRFYTEAISVMRGSFAEILGNGKMYSHIENYNQVGSGWYRIEPTPLQRRYVNASYSNYTCRVTDQVVYTRSVASTAASAVTLVDSKTIVATWSVVIYNESPDGSAKIVKTADGTKINSVATWSIPANTSVEFFWNGAQWLTM